MAEFKNIRNRSFAGLLMVALLAVALTTPAVWGGAMGVTYNFVLWEMQLLARKRVSHLRLSNRHNEVSPTIVMLALVAIVTLVALVAMIWIRYQPEGWALLIMLIGSTAFADTGAYLVGNMCGKGPSSYKFVTATSPNKTDAGFYGGYVAGAVSVLLFSFVLLPQVGAELGCVQTIVLAVTLPYVAIMGDLLMSWVKRSIQVKDFGSLLGAHGGVLDRIDSHIAVVIVYMVIRILFEL